MGAAKSYPHHLYDLIVVGSGTSAATYLNNLPTDDVPALEVLVIGKEDPWSGSRGYEKGQYTEYLNQAGQLLDRGSGSVASTSQDPVDRTAWAGENSRIINEHTTDFLDGEVRLIEKLTCDQGVQAFRVSVAGRVEIFAATEIVLATGAGITPTPQAQANYPNNAYHEIPVFAQALRDGVSVMNLDEFQQSNSPTRNGGGKSLAVFGPNAGTDAIMEASLRSYQKDNTHWFIKPGRRPGTALTFDISDKSPSWTVEQAAMDKPAGLVVRYTDDNAVTLKKQANKIEIEYVPDGGVKTSVIVDYVVYALGQTGGGTQHRKSDTGELETIVSAEIKGQLEPVYDKNMRFGSGPAQHIVGLQLQGTKEKYGLRIIGAGASQAANDVGAHNYLDDYIKDLLTKIHQITALFRVIFNNDPSQFAWLRIEKFKDILNPLSDADLETQGRAYLAALDQQLNLRAPGQSPMAVNTRNVCQSAARDLVYHQKLRQKAKRLHGERTGRSPDSVGTLLSAGLRETKPNTTGDNRLVGGLIGNIGALQEHVPIQRVKNKHGGINFSEDRQVVALFIGRNFPNIEPADANQFVNTVESERKVRPRGFSTAEIDQKMAALQVLEDKAFRYNEDFPTLSPKKIVCGYLVNN